ncbi:MAG: HEAT repeat domain-containing protein [Armatimonadota bacterium]
MPIQITCPQCGKRYAVPDSLAGQDGSCDCGATIPIPALPVPPTAAALAPLQRFAVEQWLLLKPKAGPALKLAVARPWLPAALAAWLVSFLLIPLHNRLHLTTRWPDNMLLLVVDVWVYASVATVAVILSRRLSSRPVMPAAGLLSGYAIGLLVLVVHGLSLSNPGLRWLGGDWSSYDALRHFTAFLVGLVAGEAAVWFPYLLAHPPSVHAAVRPILASIRPYARQLQTAGVVFGWLAPTVLIVRLYTHFRALPVKPWTHSSDILPYWLTLLLVPALFSLWTAQRRWQQRQIAGAPVLAFIGVQLGLLGALIIWPYPSWQRQTAAGLSALLGLGGVGLAMVAVPQVPGLISRRARAGTSVALAAIAVAIGTIITGVAVSPSLQVMVWRQAAVTMNLPEYALTRLAAVHGPEAVPLLIETLGKEHLNVAAAAEKALSNLDPAMVDALAAMLPTATLRHRCWATVFLGESKNPKAVPPLLSVLREELPSPPRDPELEVQKALACMSNLPSDLVLKAKQRRERELARYHNPPTRRTGLPPKYFFYDYTPVAARAAAAAALAKIDDPAVGPALAQGLNDPAPWVRRVALNAMGTLQYRPAIPSLRQSLESGSAEERALAAEGLTKMGVSDIALPLIKLLASDDSRELKAAAQGLVQLGDRRALKPLGQALARGSDSKGLNVLLTAYQSLGGNTLQPLLAAAENPKPWVRDFAAHKLREQHPAESVAHFAKLLQSPQRAEQAAMVLRRMSTDEARAALQAHGWPENW